MDFQFSFDYSGKPIARCSMEHEALSNWINSEIYGDTQKLAAVFALIEQAKQNRNPQAELRLIGHEFTLSLDGEEVMVQANNLAFDNTEEMEEGFSYYDQESLAFCGLEDFEHFLLQYRTFSQKT
ncbi:YacL family protein [Testudinibacter sp. P80/BLE/0925]|uniref:YacL family protein n=1 Tax=Testudinibacter sp. TW-1 TaxID=3417757 RepID=UPI003D35DC40